MGTEGLSQRIREGWCDARFHETTKLLVIVLEHRANDARCPVVRRYKASVVSKNELPEFASGVGNPVSHEVKNIDPVIQQDIAAWREKGNSDEAPQSC
jgi:hypothetical protein